MYLFQEILLKYNFSDWFIFIAGLVFYFILITIFIIITVLILVLFERKYLAMFTRRIGPNRTGIRGCLQTIADSFKLLFKENIKPANAEQFLYFISPLIVFIPVILLWLIIPFTSESANYQSQISSFLFLAVLSIPVFGVLTAGCSSMSKYSILGGIRSCIQIISSEIPVSLVLVSVVIFTGTLDLNNIINFQSGIFLNWNIFPNILGFVIFFICSLIMMNRTPFDFPESESELVAGYHCEYSGMKFAMLFLAEYALTFVICTYMTALFMGGYNSPVGFYLADLFNLNNGFDYILKNIEQLFWISIKTFLLIMLIMWIRASYPRFRFDKTLELCWYILIPLAVFNLCVEIFIKYLRGIL